ncbi:SpoIIE family protein phosphatase [Streptomyces sp. XM4193]|uniref:ATP-binding SpoIIE family protein phosphatase n=1 Tax=Streptomyces sp. XM4193 TaxID=2929782 RepID=UPI001FF86C1C|nr:SpoIIE family protein phosphatase [Streptomyces sp. XM4193]MCK1797128.1 SpoIIE family protein phosphatase [Streptomyces sp. XM4193]
MDTQGAMSGATPPHENRPTSVESILALNRMGVFDWDLDQNLLHLDSAARDVLELPPDEYEMRPQSLHGYFPPAEVSRLDLLTSQAIKEGRNSFGAYFRVRTLEGGTRWNHVQAYIRRIVDGRPHRIVGILRDATDELRHSTDRLSLEATESGVSAVLGDTTAALATARSVRDVLDVLESPGVLSRLDATSLGLGLVEGDHLRIIAERKDVDQPSDASLTRLDADLPMSEVVRTMRPVYIGSGEEFAERYPQLWPYVEPEGVGSAVCLPLVAHARVIGALGLLYRGRHDFDAHERTLLNAMSSSVAQSLQRATLFDQGRRLAEDLQRFMLPHSIPRLAGVRTAVSYRPARQLGEIGGDWYDVIPLPGGRVAIVIGDVQGHDTHAAAVMGQLRIVLRAYAAEGHPATTVMARASAFLADLDTERFATCLYAEIDPSTGWLRMVRAGHLDPLLMRGDGECRPLPVAGSLPLGLLHLGPLDYRETALELAVGETVLLYTDGLVERPGGDIEEGVQALADSVPLGPSDLDRLADWLVESPRVTSGEDDIAVLLLRRETPVNPQVGRRLHQYVAPGDMEALSGVRHMVRDATRAWRADQFTEEIVLTTHELATNALLHTEEGVTVTVRLLGGADRRLRIEVADRSTRQPKVLHAEEWHRTGRGMLLVDRLADRWGVESRGAGKCVWCEFDSP